MECPLWPSEPGDYDGTRIASLINRHQIVNARWEDLFSAHGVTPLRITYEALAADPAGICARTADFLQIGGEAIRAEKRRPLVKQATSLNAEWEARFREEAEEREALSPFTP